MMMTLALLIFAAEPTTTERIASTIEWIVKTGVTLGGAWAFLAKIAKPYSEWRRESMARTIREVLAPELKMLARVIQQEDSCADRMESVLGRLDEFFNDHDMLVDIAIDNRERHDETNELLNSLGFTSDRRASDERRERVASMIETLNDRRRERRRNTET